MWGTCYNLAGTHRLIYSDRTSVSAAFDITIYFSEKKRNWKLSYELFSLDCTTDILSQHKTWGKHCPHNTGSFFRHSNKQVSPSCQTLNGCTHKIIIKGY